MLGVLPTLAERDHMGAAEGDPSVRAERDRRHQAGLKLLQRRRL